MQDQAQLPPSLSEDLLLALASLGPQRAREALASIRDHRTELDSGLDASLDGSTSGLGAVALPESADRREQPETVGAVEVAALRETAVDLSKFFQALSDATRRGILRLLEAREYCTKELVGNFPLSQPTISRHLSILEQANLVVRRREGQFVYYRLANGALAEYMRCFFGEFRQCM